MAVQANIQHAGHEFREAVSKELAKLARQFPNHQVKSITVTYPEDGSQPYADVNIQPVGLQAYRSKAGNTVPLASRGRPPAMTEEK